LPQSLFNVLKRQPKLQESKNILQSATWPSLKYQNSMIVPGELYFMTQCFLQGNHSAAGAIWRSGFLIAGLVVQEKPLTATSATWLSLGPLQNNSIALLVRLEEKELNGSV
jgi:hypothetical protein